MKNKLFRILLISVGFIAIFFVARFIGYWSNSASQKTEFKNPTLYQKEINEINKSCPRMVDSETRFDNVVLLPNNIVQYNYTTINYKKEDINIEDYKNYATPIYLNQLKTHPLLEVFKENNTVLAYNYKDKNGVYICTITITPEMYKN